MGSQAMEDLVMEHLQYPKWQKHCQDALLELDRDRLQERVAAAEAAIFSRLQAMSPTTDNLSERHAIDDALAMLRILKRESLRLPDRGGR